ncbi:hypothetical protein HanXRQr2_Chr02g0050261 [Helianthus annuus]|uniref:Uncharacterized protein n=1 Tax=Helianthus annuus TaxID=4232 RepID=A0A9K3NZV1_HELAN|nr:hypothetical protein HanXRQr2_Chr02g0050261 [Helianthus annuus]
MRGTCIIYIFLQYILNIKNKKKNLYNITFNIKSKKTYPSNLISHFSNQLP